MPEHCVRVDLADAQLAGQNTLTGDCACPAVQCAAQLLQARLLEQQGENGACDSIETLFVGFVIP